MYDSDVPDELNKSLSLTHLIDETVNGSSNFILIARFFPDSTFLVSFGFIVILLSASSVVTNCTDLIPEPFASKLTFC